MSKVYLKDVVTRIKDKVDKDNTDLEYYIGGEHFDNGEIQITKKGVILGSTIGPAFHMKFAPGDVLLMSRNPHLRKAGVVNFEGICSDVSYVCRTKDENILMQKFLPFIFQSDDFWKFAEENKKGSTNFFLNWSDFEKYEFILPDIEIQKKLVEILWAFEDTKTAYKLLIDKTDELVKSQFIEMFGNGIDNQFEWDEGLLGEVCDVRDGTHDTPKYYEEGFPLVTSKNVTDGYIDFTNCNLISECDYRKICERSGVNVGDILMPMIGTVGKPVIVEDDREFAIKNVLLIKFRENSKVINKYILALLQSSYFDEMVLSNLKGGNQKFVSLKDMRGLHILVPPMEIQVEFADFMGQSDKSKFELRQAILDVDNLKKALLKHELN